MFSPCTATGVPVAARNFIPFLDISFSFSGMLLPTWEGATVSTAAESTLTLIFSHPLSIAGSMPLIASSMSPETTFMSNEGLISLRLIPQWYCSSLLIAL